ncbi:hypothetical protein DPMN_147419 [Dreissena polymorpha]|uniref:Uncharacterized protein n=1 Tax=Dreissena polymorpha TaxID=45954 RepID=A0A9D4J0L9_DREPO|nr:hypothetical protein DPMN_147419 [Dreissena polymorpha]
MHLNLARLLNGSVTPDLVMAMKTKCIIWRTHSSLTVIYIACLIPIIIAIRCELTAGRKLLQCAISVVTTGIWCANDACNHPNSKFNTL